VGITLAGGSVLSPPIDFAEVSGTSVTYLSDVRVPEDLGNLESE